MVIRFLSLTSAVTTTIITALVVGLLVAGCQLPTSTKIETVSLHLGNDTLLRGNHRWQGVVEITGLVRLAKGGVLIIEPGTRILFQPVDYDGDGIGDSELLIEGSIEAIGTATLPIIFTSSATEPKPMDWKYLYLDFAQRGVFDYIVSEYAYSGIQIHFCKAEVTNSIFRYNIDGVRFSTANINLSRSLIHHNRHGLRFEERGGEGVIRENEISNNRVGIFPVTKSKDRTLFTKNNILSNTEYAVKMGLEQPYDLHFPANYWGTISAEEREESFFDKSEDSILGKVIAPDPIDRFTDIPFTIQFKETFR